MYMRARTPVSAGLTLTSDHAEPENISLSLVLPGEGLAAERYGR